MSCAAVTCCDRGDYVYVPGALPPPAPIAAQGGSGSCECPPLGTVKIAGCIDMLVVGGTEYHRVCMVEDGGVFTLNVNQTASP